MLVLPQNLESHSCPFQAWQHWEAEVGPPLGQTTQAGTERCCVCCLARPVNWSNQQQLYKCITTKKSALLWAGCRCSLTQRFPISFLKNKGLELMHIFSSTSLIHSQFLSSPNVSWNMFIPVLKLLALEDLKGLKITCGNSLMNWDIWPENKGK